MKDPNGFDELARQKLAERDFAFDPAHWEAMRQLLAERERKPKVWWPWITAGVLLLGGAAGWTAMREESVQGEPARSVVAERTAHPETPALPSSETTSAARSEQEQPPPLMEAKSTNGPRRGSTSTSSADQRPRTHATGRTQHQSTIGRSEPLVPKEESRLVTTAPTADTTPGLAPAIPAEQGTVDIRSTADPAYPGAVISQGTEGPQGDPAGSNATQGRTRVTPSAQEPGPQHLSISAPAPAVDTLPGDDVSAAVLEALTGDAPAPPSPTEPPAPAPEPAPAPPPAWLALSTPFEFSLLGGAFSTGSTYTGSGTETWQAGTERSRTPGFGLEVVRNIGAHFAAGIGVHHGSYEERLTTSDLYRVDEVFSDSYYWVQHDTMVLTVVGDTTIGATTYQITELVPMTINELAIDTDTSYQSTLVRQRRSVVNAVSYVEVPLLLDAHTTAGRWVFGVRGGPMIGFLTGRRGAIPGDGENGYTDLDTRAFRSTTIGCMARAYVRYRLSAAWSVGLEPAWRRQLGNALGDDGIERRGDAFGGCVSLSYRLAPKSALP